MGNETNINWADSTFNPWIGCTQVSPACDHCYAAVATPSRTLGVEWGAGKPRHRTSAANWKLPLRWNAQPFYECETCGLRTDNPMRAQCIMRDDQLRTTHAWKPARRRVFCASLADWLDNEVPVEWLVDLLDLIRRTPNIDWLLLTKRVGNWRSRILAAISCREGISQELATWLATWIDGEPAANVWIGATICNQAEADRDVLKLLRVPAAVRFLSIEPMLGPIDITEHLWGRAKPCDGCPKDADCDCGFYSRGELTEEPALGWVIAGGESGKHARPPHPQWFRDLRDQCAAARVPFLLKQWGEWEPREEWSGHQGGGRFERQTAIMLDGSPCSHDDVPQDVGAHRLAWVGKKAAGRALDGKTHHEFPGEKAHVG
jgi:protein gp37